MRSDGGHEKERNLRKEPRYHLATAMPGCPAGLPYAELFGLRKLTIRGGGTCSTASLPTKSPTRAATCLACNLFNKVHDAAP